MSNQLATLGEIFSSSWEEYKKRALPILAVILISTGVIGCVVVLLAICIGLGGVLMVHGEIYQGWFMLLTAVACLLTLVAIILGIWFYTSMVAIIIDEHMGIIQAFRMGWQYLWPMAWVMAIYSGIIITGMLFGVLPGILCLVWFSFSFYILLAEDKRGMDAILASMEYVKGHWWNTFGKLFVVWLIYMLIGAVPFIGLLASIFFYPFLMLFTVAVYRDLEAVKGEAEIMGYSGARIFWWVVTIIGLILPIILLIGGLITLLNGDNFWFEQMSYSFHSGHTI